MAMSNIQKTRLAFLREKDILSEKEWEEVDKLCLLEVRDAIEKNPSLSDTDLYRETLPESITHLQGISIYAYTCQPMNSKPYIIYEVNSEPRKMYLFDENDINNEYDKIVQNFAKQNINVLANFWFGNIYSNDLYELIQ